MRGIRFYEEFTNKRKGESAGNVFAADVDIPVYFSGGNAVREGLGSIFAHPNSDVCVTSASLDFLRDKCKRISEARAREIHPALFERLDIKC